MKMTSIRAGAIAFLAVGGLLAGCSSKDDATSAPATSAPATAAAAPATQASTTGGGIAALGADQILARAEAALKEAKSFRVKGDSVQDSQKMSIDFEVSGDDLAGSLTQGKAVIEMLSVSGNHYIRPNEAFWQIAAGGAAQGKAVAKAVGKKWVSTKADKTFDSFFGEFTPEKFLEADGTITKGDARTVNGVPTIALKDSSGGVIYIATTGKPYPISVDSDGTITFSDFAKTFSDIKKPASADVYTKPIG